MADLHRALRILRWRLEGYLLGKNDITDEELDLAEDLAHWYARRRRRAFMG